MIEIKKLICKPIDKTYQIKDIATEKISISKQCYYEIKNIKEYKSKPLDFIRESLVIDIALSKLYLKKDKAFATEVFDHLEIICKNYNEDKISKEEVDKYCKKDILGYVENISKDKLVKLKNYPNIMTFIKDNKEIISC